MDRPKYLNNYYFDWELYDVILEGRSALDSHSFLGNLQEEEKIHDYLNSYGFEQTDPILKAELFGIYQEALQFIKRYFLTENNPKGLDIQMPSFLFTITELTDLFKLATGSLEGKDFQDCLWAGIVLKVMHTILHADKDLRSNYFLIIQQQIFDRFYKYISREEGGLYLKSNQDKIELSDFQTKAQKSRDSVIIKLLHKAENVAEELFDTVGVRFVTNTRFDTLRVIKFLTDHHIVLPHNIKPSRSFNSLIDISEFKKNHKEIVKMVIRNNLSEERFLQAVERASVDSTPEQDGSIDNKHTIEGYRSMQFTCRQLIKYRNPFFKKLFDLKKEAKTLTGNEFAQKVSLLDTSSVTKDIRFFYPFEVQIVDKEAHKINTEGEASHQRYKSSQLETAMKRLFTPLIDYLNLNID